MPPPTPPEAGALRIGVVVSTTGRWQALEHLVESVSASSHPVVAVSIANQSGARPPSSVVRLANAEIVDSSGGLSKGRNDAIRNLRGATDVMAFPNDNCSFRPETLLVASRYFRGTDAPGAIAGTLLEPAGPRMRLPAPGSPLSRLTVLKAIEPSMFVASYLAEQIGFRETLGTGNPTPWQAGEGTDLLLRIMAAGHRVLAAPDAIVVGPGELRALTEDEWRIKLRSYARGVGYVLRLHDYGPLASAVQIASPWYRLIRTPPSGIRMPVRDCMTASIGRLEGRLGRCLGRSEHIRLSATALRK